MFADRIRRQFLRAGVSLHERQHTRLHGQPTTWSNSLLMRWKGLRSKEPVGSEIRQGGMCYVYCGEFRDIRECEVYAENVWRVCSNDRRADHELMQKNPAKDRSVTVQRIDADRAKLSGL